MALTFAEQELFDFAKRALPSWVRTHDEFLTAAAKQFGSVRAAVEYLFAQTLIGEADGPTVDGPDWLNQHARDRNTSRQAGESSADLRERLRTIPDALTRDAILAAIKAILSAAGVVGDPQLLELPRDAGWLGVYTAMSGTGGSFVKQGTKLLFTPTVLPWPRPPWRPVDLFPTVRFKLAITSTPLIANASAGVLIEGIIGNAAVYDRPAGVAGSDPALTWQVIRFDASDNRTDGFARAYAGRGYRSSRQRPGALVVILPYGTPADIEAGIREAVRTKKAAGFGVIVERRLLP